MRAGPLTGSWESAVSTVIAKLFSVVLVGVHPSMILRTEMRCSDRAPNPQSRKRQRSWVLTCAEET